MRSHEDFLSRRPRHGTRRCIEMLSLQALVRRKAHSKYVPSGCAVEAKIHLPEALSNAASQSPRSRNYSLLHASAGTSQDGSNMLDIDCRRISDESQQR